MPKMLGLTDMQVASSVHGFSYSSIKADKLGASEYTIAEIITDATGSVDGFRKNLEDMIVESLKACKKSPRATNLMARNTTFNSIDRITELHGYTLLDTIDLNQFKNSIKPDGATPLYEAILEGIETLDDYVRGLYKAKKITCNAIVFIITDGDDNASPPGIDPTAIKKAITKVKQEEILESIRTILIGINDTDPHFKARLETLVKDAGIDEYVSVGQVTTQKLAKLAQFVSRSTSSQALSKGTGGPSQPISFKF